MLGKIIDFCTLILIFESAGINSLQRLLLSLNFSVLFEWSQHLPRHYFQLLVCEYKVKKFALKKYIKPDSF